MSATALVAAFGAALTAANVRPVLADGAASTRNIILGGAAATLLIINHNKKVHQKYAEYEAQNAQTAQERDDMSAAYQSERNAYQHEVALNAEFRREVAVQHQEVLRLRHELAQSTQSHGPNYAVPVSMTVRDSAKGAQPVQVAAVSYGWGSL